MTAKIKSLSKRTGHRSSHKPKGVSDHAFRKVYWPYIPLVLVIGALLSFSSRSGSLMQMVQHPEGKVLAYATSMSVSKLLSGSNVERSQAGASSLKLNSKLDAAAQAKANDMASRNYWSHNTPDGNPPWVFVSNQSYAYQKLGENLAAGFSSEEATIDGWMNSPPHRENLLDPAFSDVGFGYANVPNYAAAGGGPMTVVVAFYGKPQVLAASTVKAAATPQAASVSRSIPRTPAPKATKAPSKTASKPQPKPVEPATNLTPVADTSLGAETSRAQLAFGWIGVGQIATFIMAAAAAGAICLWLSRHALAVRRAVVRGEQMAIRHPMMDVGLLIIAALSYLLTQTAGFIR